MTDELNLGMNKMHLDLIIFIENKKVIGVTLYLIPRKL